MKRRTKDKAQGEEKRTAKKRVDAFEAACFSNSAGLEERARKASEALLKRLRSNRVARTHNLNDLESFLKWLRYSCMDTFYYSEEQCRKEREFVLGCMDAVWPLFEDAARDFSPFHNAQPSFISALSLMNDVDYWGVPGTGRCMESIWGKLLTARAAESSDASGHAYAPVGASYAGFSEECRSTFFWHKNKQRSEEALWYVSRKSFNSLDWLYAEYVKDPEFVSSLTFPMFQNATLNVPRADIDRFVRFLSLVSTRRIFLLPEYYACEYDECALSCDDLLRMPVGFSTEEIEFGTHVRLSRVAQITDLMSSLSRHPRLKKVKFHHVSCEETEAIPEDVSRAVDESLYRFAAPFQNGSAPKVSIVHESDLMPYDAKRRIKNLMTCPSR